MLTPKILKIVTANHLSTFRVENSECLILASHSTNQGHNFDFSNSKILDKQRNFEKKLILEMIEILKRKLN